MDTGLIGLRIQPAIQRRVYLICVVFIVGVFAANWPVDLAAKPLGGLLAYTVDVARQAGQVPDSGERPAVIDLPTGTSRRATSHACSHTSPTSRTAPVPGCGAVGNRQQKTGDPS